MTDKYSDDYKAGWYDGYQEAMKDRDNTKIYPSPYEYIPAIKSSGCPVCRIDFSKGAWGYVCHHPNCPTRVTCSTNK